MQSKEFEKLLVEYGPLLSRVANSYEANPALQQELLQEIALAVWQGLQRFQGNSSLKTYMLKIAHNRAVSHVASSVKHPKSGNDSQLDSIAEAQSNSPDRVLESSQQWQMLLASIRALPVTTRQVVTLSLEGLSYDEISQVCGLSKSNVGVTLNRAKQALNRSMRNEY